MAFFGAHWWFICCFAFQMVAGVLAFRRYAHGRAAGHSFEWQALRLLLSFSAFGAGLDCFKVFMGGFDFYKDAPVNEPPFVAYTIYPLVFMHLAVLPLLMMNNTVYEFAARRWKAGEAFPETPFEKRMRLVGVVFSILIALVGLLNTVQRIRATLDVGGMWKRQELYGDIAEWDLSTTEMAHDLGYFVIEPELIGAFAYSFNSVFIGVLIWCNAGRPEYFLLQFVCLVGQAGGSPILKGTGLFKYMSNFLEPVSFVSMVYVDTCFCEDLGSAPLNEKGDAELAGLEG